MASVVSERGWSVEFDRGPDWLFAKVNCPPRADVGSCLLAEVVWNAMQQHFVQRVVIDLEKTAMLRSPLIGQLVLLHKRVASHDGLMRICGVSSPNREALRITRLDDRLPTFDTCEDAVMGRTPNKPR